MLHADLYEVDGCVECKPLCPDCASPPRAPGEEANNTQFKKTLIVLYLANPLHKIDKFW